jgi:4-alpha-glucanotransferase
MSRSATPDQLDLSRAALAELGVERFLLAIHDASFPADPEEDLGVGSPGTLAASRLFELIRALGFSGVQLGPAGETSRSNASPYDSTIFSRSLASIPAAAFSPSGELAGLVRERSRATATGDGGARGDHRRGHDVSRALVGEAWSAHAGGARPELAERLAQFRSTHAWWLERDALYAALRAAHGDTGTGAWAEHGAGPLDATLWIDDGEARVARRAELLRRHARAIEAYAFGQLLAHEAHARVVAQATALGLALFGDLQVGVAESDVWSYAPAFLTDYVMGAPPSRTNQEGQPWNYPVLDPMRMVPGGAALELLRARADKAFVEHDGLRVDHPHGLVCPWVYRRDHADPAVAVRLGARLYESPDLPDHPDLARFAIASPAQIDRSAARHADGWVVDLTPAQVERQAIAVDTLVAAAARHGRPRDAISCEVLSTMPLPLGRVLARYGLGRWRVLQKANLDDATDVYRSENAMPADWVMLGNHDTPSIYALITSWDVERRKSWATHLVARLALPATATAVLARDPGLLATAMLAELLACRAGNVMVFFADLFGCEERFNVPGTVNDINWSLRLPAGFATLYAERLALGRALDLPLALALSLRARGSTSKELIARLWEVTTPSARHRAAGLRG